MNNSLGHNDLSEEEGSEYYDRYIRIPSDLFGERLNRQAPSVLLPTSYSGRSAGVYPPPRPLSQSLQPWALGTPGRNTDVCCPFSQRHRCRFYTGQDKQLESSESQDDDSRRQTNPAFKRQQCRTCCDIHYQRCKGNLFRRWKPSAKKNEYSLNHPLIGDKNSCRCQKDDSQATIKAKPSDRQQKKKKTCTTTARGHHINDNHFAKRSPVTTNTATTHHDFRHRSCCCCSKIPTTITSTTLHLPPVLCTFPCAIYSRHFNKTPPRQRDLDRDLLYSTCCHGGEVKVARRRTRDIRYPSNNDGDFCQGNGLHHHQLRRTHYHQRCDAECPTDANGKRTLGRICWRSRSWDDDRRHNEVMLRADQQRQYQEKLFRAKLPGALATEELVLSWLKHGSVPLGESHFPDLTRNGHKVTVEPHTFQIT